MILDALCPGAWGVVDRPFGKGIWAEIQAPNATTRETGDATTTLSLPCPRAKWQHGEDIKDTALVRPYMRTTQGQPGSNGHP